MENFILRDNTSYHQGTWKGGKTTEIYIYPEDSNYKKRNFEFRFSFATIEIEESAFSNLVGFERISIPTKQDITLINNLQNYKLKRNQPYYFRGSDQVKSIGISEDINLIYCPKWKAKLNLVSLSLIDTFKELDLSADVIGIYVLKGKCQTIFNDNRLQLLSKNSLIIKNFEQKKMKLRIENDFVNSQVALFCLRKV